MTEYYGDQALVVLNAPPNLEETVVDWLLAREDAGGFTSFAVFGHSTSHSGLSAAEQVSGRRRRQQFQVQIQAGLVEAFIEEARASFGRAGIHFWVLPLIAGGDLDVVP
jgi:hypothetical protein